MPALKPCRVRGLADGLPALEWAVAACEVCFFRKWFLACVVAVSSLSFSCAAWAQMPASAGTDRVAALEKQASDNAASIAAAQTAGDNGWMLVRRGAGADDERAGARTVLRRPGATQERAGDDDADLCHDEV